MVQYSQTSQSMVIQVLYINCASYPHSLIHFQSSLQCYKGVLIDLKRCIEIIHVKSNLYMFSPGIVFCQLVLICD